MRKILVIEDEPSARESILDLLQAEGFTGIGAETGIKGLQIAQERLPNLILCDVMLPELDGYAVLASLRQNPSTMTIPFIFLTGLGEKADLRQGMQLGADDYITKPCTAVELLNAISTRLAKQDVLAQQYASEQQRAKALEQKVQELQQVTSTQDELLSYFYQELRNPLSNLNRVIDLLRDDSQGVTPNQAWVVAEREYAQELAVLNRIGEFQEVLTPETVQLLQQCNLFLSNSDEKDPGH